MAKEIEFKFIVDPERAEALAALPLLNQYAAGEPKQKRLINTYYDTPELSLRDQKMGLRIRKSGDDWIQTIKGEANRGDGLSIREEVEHPLAENKLNMSLLRDTAFDHIGRDEDLAARMKPAFTTDFKRLKWDLHLPDGVQIEAALDRGEVIADGRTEPICELELELISGDLPGMERFAEQLLTVFPMERGTKSKAQRGYALAVS